MTASLVCRHTISGQLVARSPIHIGDHTDGIDIDLRQVVDGRGRVVLPGTAITGALRAALATEDPGWDGDQWWGSATDGSGRASSVRIDDAPAGRDAVLEVRDGVSIDRVTGAAASGHLYSRAVVAAGTTFSFQLTMDVAEARNVNAADRFLNGLMSILCGNGIRVGAATSTGLGHVALREVSWCKADLTSPAGLEEALLGRDRGERVSIPDAKPTDVRPGHLRIEVAWRPVGPIMTMVAAEGHHASGFPQTRLDAGAGSVTLVLPGSSVKGALRSHCERIVRTVLASPEALPEPFLEQLEAADELAGIVDLFGTAGNADCGEPGLRGSLTVSDTTCTVSVPVDEWNRVRHGRAGQDGRALEQFMDDLHDLNTVVEHDGLWFDLPTRNAVDRWSGGVAHGALYSVVEPYAEGDAWNPIVLELDVARLRRRSTKGVDPAAAVALLLLLLRDLCEGWIPLGFGTTRGLGSIATERDKIKFAVAKDLASANDVIAQLDGRKLKSVLASKDLLSAFDKAWSAAVPADMSEARQ